MQSLRPNASFTIRTTWSQRRKGATSTPCTSAPIPVQGCGVCGSRAHLGTGGPGRVPKPASPAPVPPPDRDPQWGLWEPRPRAGCAERAWRPTLTPSSPERGGRRAGSVVSPVQDPRRHFVLCGNLRSSPLKKQRSIPVFVGWRGDDMWDL